MDILIPAFVPKSLSLYFSLALFFIAIFVFNYLKNKILLKIASKLESSKGIWDKSLINASIYPSSSLIWLLFIVYSLKQFIAAYPSIDLFTSILYHVKAVGIILSIAWFILNLINQLERNYYKEIDKDSTLDSSSSNLLGKVSRAFVVIFTITIILQIYEYPLSALLTVGGAGTFAIGFAAKDMLANFFGGLTVYLDKPFKVGDWIRFQNGDIEGTVERIGWRSTRLRNFDKRPVYIPNNLWVSNPVENATRMVNRRVKEFIGIRYQDSAKICDIINDIEEVLKDHPSVDHRQNCIVKFSGFADSSLNIMVYFFTKSTKLIDFSAVKQDVLLAVIDIVHKHKADFAFPTRTVEIVKSD